MAHLGGRHGRDVPHVAAARPRGRAARGRGGANQDEVARRRAMEERLRIARELHDSLTHSISVIQVQAGVAVHLARKRGEEVPPALLAIQEAGADAVRELRATLGVLRSEEDGDGSGLGQLDRLVARARAAGLPVTVTVTGAERPLPPEVDQADRIVQEALTNVSRHAGQARASVQLYYTPRPSRSRSTTTARHRHQHQHPARARAGPHRHAGTGDRARRPAPRRTAGRRRLPGARRTPRAGTVVIRILLADDQALIRSGIRALLEAEDDIEVVAEAADGRQAVKRPPSTCRTSRSWTSRCRCFTASRPPGRSSRTSG